MDDTIYDAVVIGGGQAGLAAGYHLKRAGMRFVIIDASARIGDSWRRRYDSLTLFTPRRFSTLPGLPPTGDPDGYAGKDEFAAYLEAYAEVFDLPVRSGEAVTALRREARMFAVETSLGQRLAARNVIVASGAFQVPAIPPIARQFAASVVQLSASDYRNPAQLPDGPVIVVGDGASGRDIAVELAAGRPTLLASGRRRRLLPERLFGQSIWSWLDRLGLMRAAPSSLVGRIMRRNDPFPDRQRNVRALVAAGVRLKPRLTGARDGTAQFADGTSVEAAAIIWAAGYRDELGWIVIPEAFDTQGFVVNDAGRSPVPGLYFLGRPWQRNRASALVMGAGDDAKVVVDAMAAFSI